MNDQHIVGISFRSNDKICCLCLSDKVLPDDKNFQITFIDTKFKKVTELGKMLITILKLSNCIFTRYCCQICMDAVFKCFDALLEINVAASLACQQLNVKDGGSFHCSQCNDSLISIDSFTQHIKRHLLDGFLDNTKSHKEVNEIDFSYFNENRNDASIENDLQNIDGSDASESIVYKDCDNPEEVESPCKSSTLNLCHKCGKCYGTVHGLKLHLKIHDPNHKNSKRKSRKKGCHLCEKCGKSFTTTETLRVHREKHDTTCNICGKSMYKKYMRHHLLLHDKQLPNLLRQRKQLKQFSTLPALDSTPLQCDHCGKSYIDRYLLVNHIALMHGGRFERGQKRGKRRGIKCSLCGLILLSHPKLKQHKREEHGVISEDRLQCELCKRWYSGKMCLRTHIKYEHMNIKPYRCKLCPKMFKRHQGLWAHMRAHQDFRPYECGVCQMSYRQRYEVINHLAKHVRAGDINLDEAFAKTFMRGNNEGMIYLRDQKTKQANPLTSELQVIK